MNPFSRVSFLEKLLFTKNLSVMIKSGITLSEALPILVTQTKSNRLKKTLLKVQADIQNGQPLSASLAKHPHVFDEFYVSMIEVAEEAGLLDINLQFLADQLGRDYALRKKIQGAMLYPILVLLTTFVMSVFVSLFILPKLTDLFSTFRVDLPLPTQVLLFVAKIMKQFGGAIFLGFFLCIIVISQVLRIPKIKYRVHIVLLELPIIGNFLLNSQLAHFSRNLGTLLRSGVPIDRSIDITARTLSNLKLRHDLLFASSLIAKGENLAHALKHTKHNEFPILAIKMIEIGEKTGKLDEELLYLSDFYEAEIDDSTKNLTILIEPILLLAIGFVVGFIAIAIIGPIYQLIGSFKR